MPDSHEYITSLEDVKIGKNVLESLTRSAYDDCRCILREYVQNAADQIDIAKEQHLSEDDDYAIHLDIRPQSKYIEIEDNATGVRAEEIYPLLRNVACSRKDRKTRKGFRGIGRLGGLGYCDTLTFVTSYKGENVRSILKWNASKMSKMIDDEEDESSASEVVSTVTTLYTEPEKVDKHYFKVILENVNDDRLLDVDDIRNYLSMVAPVEIANTFSPFKNKIKKFMEENHLTLDTYDVFVNRDPVYKMYTKTIYDKNKIERDSVRDVVCNIRVDSEGKPLYWWWYSICTLDGMIDYNNVAHGIRLRCKNIQLGDETNCRRFLPNKQDQRFNDYFFGEIHVLSEFLVPNMDRNYLRVDAVRDIFERLAIDDFKELKALCYQASGYRSDYKKIADAKKKGEQLEEKKKQQKFASEEQLKREEEEFEKSQREAQKAKQSMDKRMGQMRELGSPIADVMQDAYNPESIGEQAVEEQPNLFTSQDEEKKHEAASESHQSTEDTYGPSSYVRTSKPIYDRFNGQSKEVINIVYKIIGDVLPIEEMREALITKIEEELTK